MGLLSPGSTGAFHVRLCEGGRALRLSTGRRDTDRWRPFRDDRSKFGRRRRNERRRGAWKPPDRGSPRTGRTPGSEGRRRRGALAFGDAGQAAPSKSAVQRGASDRVILHKNHHRNKASSVFLSVPARVPACRGTPRAEKILLEVTPALPGSRSIERRRAEKPASAAVGKSGGRRISAGIMPFCAPEPRRSDQHPAVRPIGRSGTGLARIPRDTEMDALGNSNITPSISIIPPAIQSM